MNTPFSIHLSGYAVPEYIQQEMQALANSMCFKIEKNQHKYCPMSNPDNTQRDHRHLDAQTMWDAAYEELMELRDAIANEDIENIKEETGDVANMMAFIHGAAMRGKIKG